jgi:protein O-mannosyl-transferase
MDKTIIAKNRHDKNPTSFSARPFPNLLAVGAVLLAVIAYWPVKGYDFVFDDTQQIVENPAITAWSFVPQYFTANVWAGVFPGAGGDYYRPLFLLWLRINYVLFHHAPWGWHLMSLLAHLGAVWIFFLMAREWTRDGIVAGCAALLFAVHPIHIEAVAWVSAVPEILFALAGMGSIYCYLRFQKNGSPLSLFVSAMLYGIALLSKETAAAVWPILFVCEWWRASESRSRTQMDRVRAVLKTQVPFAAVTAIYGGLRLHALHGISGGEVTHTPAAIVHIAPFLVWSYLKKLGVPSGMSPLYFDPEISSFASPRFYLPLIAVIGVGIGLFLWGRKSTAVAFSGLLLAIPLVPPILGVSVFPSHDLSHDRYLYLPSAGFCMLLALALRWVCGLVRAPWRIGEGFAHMVIVAAAIGLVVVVRVQEPQYHDNIALFTSAVRVSPESEMAWGFLGEAFMKAGRYPEGIAAFQHAVKLGPESFLNNYRLGAAYYWVHEMPSAELSFQRAVDHFSPRVVSLDYALYRLGLSQYAQAKMALAETTLRRAIQLRPSAPGYHRTLGAAMAYRGELSEAKEQLEVELKIGPDPETSRILSAVDEELAQKKQR